MEFLECLAANYNTSQERGLPAECISKAATYGKDPYIVWLSMLRQDFPHDASPWEWKQYSLIGKGYLISVMKINCRDQNKQWWTLAMDAREDRKTYKASQSIEGLWKGKEELLD